MRPVICMITPPISRGVDRDGLVDRIHAAARAGVHLIQIRQPELEGRELLMFVRDAVAAVFGTQSRVLVNDRVDVALAAAAHGVHLRSSSAPAARVRPIVPPGFVIGRSVHSLNEARQVVREGGLDYLTFGTVFASASKPAMDPAGTERLAAVCGAVLVPVLAIGGMTHERLDLVRRAGAAGFAAIGLFANGPAAALEGVVREAGRVFDTSAGVP